MNHIVFGAKDTTQFDQRCKVLGRGEERRTMTQEQKIIPVKVGVLELAKQLGKCRRLAG